MNNGVDADVSYNEKGLAKSIYGKFTDITINNDKDAIRSMYNVKELFGFVDPINEFTLKKIDENQEQVIYRFQQIYEGYLVYSNEVIIAVDRDGNAISITGKYTPIGDIDLINVIDKNKAVKSVSDRCRKGSKYELEKVVYVDKNDGSVQPAWMIRCTNKAYVTEDKTVFVNAKSGEVILEVPLTISNN